MSWKSENNKNICSKITKAEIKKLKKNPVKYLLCVVHTTCHFLVYIIRWFRILVLIINIRACQDCFDTSARINFILILVHKSSSSFQHITGKISVKGIWRLIRNNTINNRIKLKYLYSDIKNNFKALKVYFSTIWVSPS